MEIPGNLPMVDTSGSSKSAATLTENFDTFLQLLTTQMQNQDPLKPMDSHEFTQQLVQFTGVEQSIATNKNLELMLGMMLASQSANAVGYIGKRVTAEGATTTLADGAARWSYELAGDADTVAITVSDAGGKLVYATTGETTAGTHEFVWDGKDANGNALPEGSYTIEVTATGADGEPMQARTMVAGVVTGVQVKDGEPFLVLGDIEIPLLSVRRVQEPTPAA